jgi:hypothetical protein
LNRKLSKLPPLIVASLREQRKHANGAGGKVATFKLSPNQLEKTKWFAKTDNASVIAQEQAFLIVNVYLDFTNVCSDFFHRRRQ